MLLNLATHSSLTQLGGEFIFENATTCLYAHRMTNTRSHAPIREVASLAGVKLDFSTQKLEPSPPSLLPHATTNDNSDTPGDSGSGDNVYECSTPWEGIVLGAPVGNWNLEKEEDLEPEENREQKFQYERFTARRSPVCDC